MKKSNIPPKPREGDWQSPRIAQNLVDQSISRLNDEINFLASMGYFVIVDTETISAGDGYYFTQAKSAVFLRQRKRWLTRPWPNYENTKRP